MPKDRKASDRELRNRIKTVVDTSRILYERAVEEKAAVGKIMNDQAKRLINSDLKLTALREILRSKRTSDEKVVAITELAADWKT